MYREKLLITLTKFCLKEETIMGRAEKKTMDGKEYTKAIETDIVLYTHEDKDGIDANFEGSIQANCSDEEVCGFVKHILDIFAKGDKRKTLRFLYGLTYLYKDTFEGKEPEKEGKKDETKEEQEKDIEVRVIKVNSAKGLKDIFNDMFKD
jgi:hypothetical protein